MPGVVKSSICCISGPKTPILARAQDAKRILLQCDRYFFHFYQYFRHGRSKSKFIYPESSKITKNLLAPHEVVGTKAPVSPMQLQCLPLSVDTFLTYIFFLFFNLVFHKLFGTVWSPAYSCYSFVRVYVFSCETFHPLFPFIFSILFNFFFVSP